MLLNIASTFAILATLLASQAGADDPLPVARWDFGAEEATSLKFHGGVHRDVPGPRPPEYPDFPPDNTAIKLDGKGSYFSLDDIGVQSPFDFSNGDAITLEAWVQVDSLSQGQNVYVIGKGRTGSADFAADNQNWALRLRETMGKAGVSFLFATVPETGKAKPGEQWHRWTTSSGFAPGKSWHHIAISYQFGDSASIRGWIDGKLQPGTWDMGGATTEAPVVDNDAIWIGSSQGGAAANSFRGSLDAIAVYREVADEKVMQTRFRRVGEEIIVQPAPEIMPELGELPTGRTLVTLHEGMPDHNRWLNNDEEQPAETLRWNTESFLLDRLPQRYDAWGIRADWKPPVLVRFATELSLTPGKHRILMRVRGLSRLWADGELIAKSKPVSGSPSGEEPMTPVADPPLPGLRIAEHRQQEIFGEVTINAEGRCRVVLETLVGGKAFRCDPGELCVAVETSDGSSFQLLNPNTSRPVMLSDADVEAELARLDESLRAFDADSRHRAASGQDQFWKMRHDFARQWAAQHPAPPVPQVATHPIDAFLVGKIQRAFKVSAESPMAESRAFHSEILPILRDHCFRCHSDKASGGLLLNSREAAIKGGDSKTPALTPGNASDSELIRRVRAESSDERMPPGDDGLNPQEIAMLEAWIREGAKWPAIYDIKHVTRLILTSNLYQREATGTNLGTPPESRFFVAPDRRRMSAEQIVDSLCSAAGQKLDVEELTFDPDARRPASNRLTLGVPRRAWMMASLANERDRPSLGLPRARAIVDIMEAFGWTGSRQNPRTDRETAPNVLQPGVLANSTASILLTRASQNSGLAEIAVSASTPEELVDTILLRYLSRLPSAAERESLAEALLPGFHERVRHADEIAAVPAPVRLPAVTWSNHLSPESTTIALQLEQRARTGPPPDPRLQPEWREVFEDIVWSVINISEFVWIP